jgi:hypothetical protein
MSSSCRKTFVRAPLGRTNVLGWVLAEHQITRDDPLPSPRPDLIPSVLRSESEWEVDRAF